MKNILILSSMILAVSTSAFAADELDPNLQKQISKLEALAAQAQKPVVPTAVAGSSALTLSAGGAVAPLDPANGVKSAEAISGSAATTLPVLGDGAAPTSEASIPALKAAETDIPVLTKFNKKVEADTVGTPTRVLGTFGIVVGILLGALFFLRRYTKKQSSKVKHTQIKVMAQHHLGPKKSLAIIRVAGESLLIGVTDQSISMIKQLHVLDEDMPEEEVTEDFRQRLERSTSEGLGTAALPAKASAPASVSASAKGLAQPKFGLGKRPAPAAHPVAKARQVFESEADDQLNENDEFMMRGIRDIVSDRLRNRKTLV